MRAPLKTGASTLSGLQSVAELLTTPSPASPLLSPRSRRRHYGTLHVPLSEIQRVSRTSHVSVTATFLTALLRAFADYHQHLASSHDQLSVALPVNVRSRENHTGGNLFAPVRLAAPLSPAERPTDALRVTDHLLRSVRGNAALQLFPALAPAFGLLPEFLLQAGIRRIGSTVDLIASSNVGPAHSLYLSGAQVTSALAFGPRGTTACITTLLSFAGTCGIAYNLDPRAITDVTYFDHAVRRSFAEYLGVEVLDPLGGAPRRG
ncbi:WS/DGAT domain-containing protein [Streptomyces sp. Ac-502]|uniref:WS/DGAT domain-containing protein n=1 Tax=Streptomyces sp. Ac-502 TaxID=3342801 RepID=UPI00386230FD